MKTNRLLKINIMKKIVLIGLTIILFLGCQQQEQRYFGESEETKTLKAGITAYENGNWDTWRSHFADTAKIFVNSDKSVSLDARVENLKSMTTAFKSYGFDHGKEHIEMVIDKEDETWVYYWASHNGTMVNNKELSIPVHLAVQFVNGKIVTEHVYFDATELNAEIAALTQASSEPEE